MGFLASGTASSTGLMVDTFREAMRGLGWVEGRNVAYVYRFGEGRFERLPGLAAELVARPVDLIVAVPTAATVAAMKATATIPIVGVNVADPVAMGLAQSLSRPGGNVTGLAFSFTLDVWGKQLQILKEAVPGGRHIAVLTNPLNPGHSQGLPNIKSAAKALDLSLRVVEAPAPEALDAAFAMLARDHVDMLVVLGDPMFGSYADRLAQLSTHYRLPTMHGTRSNVEAGGLMMFAPNLTAQLAQAAVYVDKILKGARPGELPFEQPNKFELVINLRTARLLRLTLPQSLLLRADRLID
ncbi:MAG: ABC transporter substrate-binding protein [Burkholderiaceae bacterium]|nr:ABC transporter substrate-binding protein [Burkholderiaceae bacterium]